MVVEEHWIHVWGPVTDLDIEPIIPVHPLERLQEVPRTGHKLARYLLGAGPSPGGATALFCCERAHGHLWRAGVTVKVRFEEGSLNIDLDNTVGCHQVLIIASGFEAIP